MRRRSNPPPAAVAPRATPTRSHCTDPSRARTCTTRRDGGVGGNHRRKCPYAATFQVSEETRTRVGFPYLQEQPLARPHKTATVNREKPGTPFRSREPGLCITRGRCGRARPLSRFEGSANGAPRGRALSQLPCTFRARDQGHRVPKYDGCRHPRQQAIAARSGLG